MPSARRTYCFDYLLRLFSLPRVGESKEELRVRSKVVRNWETWFEIEFFCWKCTILVRCLNRVGCEFWDLSRNRKGHVSADSCCQICYLSPRMPWISNLSFCPFWLSFSGVSTSTCALLPLTHSRVCHLLIYSSTSHFHVFLILMFSPRFATMVCASLFLYGKWGVTALIGASARGHTAIVQLLLEAGADKEAKSKVRKKRENYTQRHMWLTKWFEGRSTMWPLFTTVVAVVSTCTPWGGACSCNFFLIFNFFRCEGAHQGGSNAKRTCNFFLSFLCVTRSSFSRKSTESQKKIWVCTREFWKKLI